jgi:hypothetical protein
MSHKINKNPKGYTLLFTILISGVILAIALGVSRIAATEVILSSISSDGAKAFFASDTGLECALYHDLDANVFLDPQNNTAFDCAGFSFDNGEIASSGIPSEFAQPSGSLRNQFELDLPGNTCARIYVYKDWRDDDNDSFTRIESLGYNKTCTQVETHFTSQVQPDIVERALRVTYRNSIQISGQGNTQGQTQGQGQGQTQ